jgi:hypothetical protein
MELLAGELSFFGRSGDFELCEIDDDLEIDRGVPPQLSDAVVHLFFMPSFPVTSFVVPLADRVSVGGSLSVTLAGCACCTSACFGFVAG